MFQPHSFNWPVLQVAAKSVTSGRVPRWLLPPHVAACMLLARYSVCRADSVLLWQHVAHPVLPWQVALDTAAEPLACLLLCQLACC